MKKSTKIILLLSAILISLGLIFTIGGLASGVQLEEIVKSGRYNMVLYERKAENEFSPDGRYTISPTGIQSLSILWTDGTITIAPYDGTEILLAESSSAKLDEEHHLGYTTSGGVLQIFDDPVQAAVNFTWGQPISPRDLHIYLPSTLAQELEDLELNCTSTELDLRSLCSKTLSINTLDGTITVQDSSMDHLEVDGADADLHLQDSKICTLNVDNLDGSITIDASAVDQLDINTMDGNLSGTFLHCPQSILFDSLSGSMELCLPSDSQFTAQWDSFSGAYTSTFQGSYRDHTHIVGDGSAQISMNTMDGTLQIISTELPT